MSKRMIGLGAAVLVVAGGAAAAPYAMASATTSATHFTVYAHAGTDRSIDVGRSGFSAGDYEVDSGRLGMGGQTVGYHDGDCVTVRVGASSADQLCTFTLHLRRGQLVASGVVRSGQQGPGTFALPITGGTGRFAGAGGTLTITAGNGPTIPMTVDLTS
jgi:hypothetical protein